MRKEICSYLNKNTFCIIVPVVYEYRKNPAKRIVFVGSKKECENTFCNYPDTINATSEENKKDRQLLITEYLFLKDRNNKKELNRFKIDNKIELLGIK